MPSPAPAPPPPGEAARSFAAALLLTLLACLALLAWLGPREGPLGPGGRRQTEAPPVNSGPVPGAAQLAIEPLAGNPVQAAATDGGGLDGAVGRAQAARSVDQVLGEAEYPYGPLLAGWDTVSFVRAQGGALAAYREAVGAESLSGAELVERVAREHSLSPKVLLALIEMETGAVRGPGASARLAQPFGAHIAGRGLNAGLRSAAAWLDDGFYGLLHRQTRTLHFVDGSQRPGPLNAGAAHFALARFLALSSAPAALPGRLAAFAAAYDGLFGGLPAGSAALAPVPPQPPLLLPWPAGDRWYFTGGPHGGWGVATAWAAVDFAPPTELGCGAAPEWAVAAAPGLVVRSERGLVALDLDGDGFEGSGWVLVYLHMATPGRVPLGSYLNAGDRIGHPSCEGGRSTGAHLHFARKHDGRWLPAFAGPAPMELSGWSFAGGQREYDGSMASEGQVRNAVTSGRGGRADVLSDNGPDRWAALASAWRELAAGTTPAAVAAFAPAMAPGAGVPAVAPVQAGAVQVAGLMPPADSPELRAPGLADAPESVLLPGGSSIRSTLRLRLDLPSGRSSATPFSVAVLDESGETQPLIGHTDAQGLSGPLSLGGLGAGRYTLVVRVPGFKPQTLHRVALGSEPTELHLGGRLTPLLAGEMTGDDRVDGRDVATWLVLAVRRNPRADVNGDGRVSASDLRLILASALR